MKKLCSMLLVLTLLSSLLASASAADAYATARTPLFDIDSARGANAERAAWAINGTALYYGESFSFNSAVGPRTVERGYQEALNGRGSEVVGGGVAQAATTLYLALENLNADDVAYTQLSFYGDRFTGSYVSDGDLAIMTDYNEDHDFCFTNYAADMLYIEMWVSNGYLYCSVALSDAVSGDSSWTGMSDTAPVPSWDSEWSSRRVLADVTLDCGTDEAVLTNVALAAASVYDTALCSGNAFSFNNTVGPREQRYGYISAVNGRGAEVTGGGVAQVASAIWLAIKDLRDISIIEKSTYGSRYTGTYVASSADAILTDYNAGTDFSFRYNGEGSITLYTTLEDSILRCRIVAN